MKKIELIIKKDIIDIDGRWGRYLQGWMMSNLDSDLAKQLHHERIRPYSLSVLTTKDNYILSFNFLNDELANILLPILVEMNSIELNSKKISIESKKSYSLSLSDLATNFYKEDVPREFEIYFKTPTGFKSDEKNIFMPDVYYIFQNLMSRYGEITEGTPFVERELLSEICKSTNIVSYRIQSSYYPVHKSYIPGFIGKIKLRCSGSQTLVNYIGMLLNFAEYSGVGIKTTMGMGAVNVRKVYRHG